MTDSKHAAPTQKPVTFFNRRQFLGTAGTLAGTLAAGTLLGSNNVWAAAASKKITVITGSPHRRGATFLLADHFIRGAREAGAEVFRFDSGFKRVTPCSGCDRCGLGSSDCVYRDDMFEVNPHLIDADLVVFCSPLYYFGFSAQIKAVIDRFYAINTQLHVSKEAVLLAAAWNSSEETFPALIHHYEALVRYMGWTDVGQVCATGCGTRSACEGSVFPQQAYELGRKVGVSS